MASTAQADGDGCMPPPRLSIITFNMLCPAYKRCHTSIPTSVGPSPITPEAVTVGAGAGSVATSTMATSIAAPSSNGSSGGGGGDGVGVGMMSISDANGDGDGDPDDGCTELHLPPALAKAGADGPAAQCRGHASAAPPTGMLPFGTYPSSPINSNRYRESSVASEWRERVSRILRALGEARADVVCLQEWWGVEQAFREMFLAAPEVRDYRVVEKIRPGGKDDGIAVLLRRRWLHTPAAGAGGPGGVGAGAGAVAHYELSQSVLSRHDIALSGFGNRIGLALQVLVQVTPLRHEAAVALAAEMAAADAAAAAAAPVAAGPSSPLDDPHHSWAWQHDMQQRLSAAPAAPAPSSFSSSSSSSFAPASAPGGGVPRFHEFLLLVTHLTFPHSSFDLAQRQLEVCHLLGALEDVQLKALPGAVPPLAALPVVLVGDFNTAADFARDFVYAEIAHPARGGFTSTFAAVHAGAEPGVTHRNHRRESVPVDFIFLKPGNAAAAAAAAAPGASVAAPAANADSGTDADALPTLRPIYSSLLPVSLPDLTWPAPHDFALSDHRPLLTVFELGGLSARRPTTGQAEGAKQPAGRTVATGAPDGSQGGSTTGASAAAAAATAGASASPSPSPNPVAGPGRARVVLAVLSSSARHLCDAASRTCQRIFGWSHPQAKHEPKCELPRPSSPTAALPSRL